MGPHVSLTLCERITSVGGSVCNLLGCGQNTLAGSDRHPPYAIRMSLFGMVHAGRNFRGSLEVRLDWVSPSGRRRELGTKAFRFEGGEDRGSMTIEARDMEITVGEAGEYWIEASINRELKTAVPMIIRGPREH